MIGRLNTDMPDGRRSRGTRRHRSAFVAPALFCAGVALLVTPAACAHVNLPGPVTPAARAVTRVTVAAVEQPAAAPAIVSDGRAITAIASSWAFSQPGWSPANGRELLPLYRIEFEGEGQRHAVYWLGTNAHPPRFPCYSWCSGWWVAPSLPSGELDASRYKGLADTVAFPLFRHLPLVPERGGARQ
jgi:hypothetical protein